MWFIFTLFAKIQLVCITLYWIFRKNSLSHKKPSVSHHAYIHEPRLSHNMRKSSLWTEHEDEIRQITTTICRAIKLTACTLSLSIILHWVSVPLSDVLPVVSSDSNNSSDFVEDENKFWAFIINRLVGKDWLVNYFTKGKNRINHQSKPAVLTDYFLFSCT